MMYTKKQDKFAATFEEKTKECPLYARNMLALESMEFSRKEINMTKKYDEKEIRADYRRLTKLLIEKKMTITTMESATSGQIASLITDTEGSSAVLRVRLLLTATKRKLCRAFRQKLLTNTRYIPHRRRKRWQKPAQKPTVQISASE